MASRRDLMKGAGAVGLSSLTMRWLNGVSGSGAPVRHSASATPNGSSSGGHSSRSVPMFGINTLEWSEITRDIGPVPGKRESQNGPNGMPKRWPSLPSSVRLGVVSSNPNMDAVLGGHLDGQMAAYARSVPAGQVVTVWHEGERSNLHKSAKELVGTIARAHSVMKRANPNIKFVQIITTYSAKSRGKEFGSFICPTVDAVYMDAYCHSSGTTIEDLTGPAVAGIHAAAGRGMPLGLAETNSTVLHSRGAWIANAYKFAAASDYEICYTFWGNGYYWNKSDSSTVAAMKAIMRQRDNMRG